MPGRQQLNCRFPEAERAIISAFPNPSDLSGSPLLLLLVGLVVVGAGSGMEDDAVTKKDMILSIQYSQEESACS